MKKMEYTDESNFITEVVDIDDNVHDLINRIYDTLEWDSYLDDLTSILVCKDKESLCFGVDLSENKIEREIQSKMYKITVSKI